MSTEPQPEPAGAGAPDDAAPTKGRMPLRRTGRVHRGVRSGDRPGTGGAVGGPLTGIVARRASFGSTGFYEMPGVPWWAHYFAAMREES